MTLGPGGRPILLEIENRSPISTKDGVTVARHFEHRGDLENIVAKAAIEICERTVRDAGDGTTTAIVLGAALVEAGQNWLVKNPTYSPQRLARELKHLFIHQIKPEIEKLSRSIRDLPIHLATEAVIHVGFISANGDLEIAHAVAEAVESVGQDGLVIAEEGAGNECRVEYQEGFSFSSGLSDLGGAASAAFVNRQDYGDCVIEGGYVVFYDGEIHDVNVVAPILERVASELAPDGTAIRSPIIICAHRFSDQVLKMLAQNFRRGVLMAVPVRTARNGHPAGPVQFLHDLAAYCGGTVFDPQGLPLPQAHLSQLGFAASFKYSRTEGVIIGAPDQSRVEARIEDLKTQMETANEFDQDLLRFRIGRLTGGVATIYAGGKTQLEAKERHARVTDAICAVRSALQKGVVPGGGATFAVIAKDLSGDGPEQIFAEALVRPFYQILENVGVEGKSQPHFDLGVWEKDGPFMVIDAVKAEYVDWWKAGIMDPTKVTLAALENALSVSQLLMTLGGAIVIQKTEGGEQVKAMQEGLLKAMQEETMG